MTAWAIVVDFDTPAAADHARQLLADALEKETGVRPRTRTIMEASLRASGALLVPPFREIANGRTVLPTFGEMGRKVG